MRVLCVIPARLASTRLPNKPLLPIGDQPLIGLVARRVVEFGVADGVVVASEESEVLRAAADVGVQGLLTSASHRSGTERVAEVVRRPEFGWADLVINVQGDEPFVPREALTGSLDRVRDGDAVGTAAAPLAPAEALDPNRVKVTVDATGRATGFTRDAASAGRTVTGEFLQHIGVYAYTPSTLIRWIEHGPTPAESHHRLEQLRALAAGFSIGVAILSSPARPGIDTHDDWCNAQTHFAALWPEVR